VDKPKIHILLSTYNGEKYLKAQLDSIFEQTYKNFVLFIRDDGSSDHTVEIIQNYRKQNDFIASRIRFVKGKNVGWQRSFWLLLEQSKGAKYYAFCDQDDVWLPQKLEAAIDMLEKEDNIKPILYYANYSYCDEKLNMLHEAPKPKMPLTFRNVMLYTPAFGFAIVINESLRHKALETSDKTGLAHDGWVQKIAAALGIIIFDEKSRALYRRHGNAVTAGNAGIGASISYWIRNEILGDKMKQELHYPLDRFLQEYGTQMNERDRRLITVFAGKTKNPVRWVKRLCYPKRLRPSIGGELALRVGFLLNRY
jgi:glycosyltransferase involved in cell wall biosynthesis